jgi:signal recognition particle GTPase
MGHGSFFPHKSQLTQITKFCLVRAIATHADTTEGFEQMLASTKKKYYMLGGKGAVGKTSCAASLAVKFAIIGHPTLVVSTDLACSLSDSFAQVALSICFGISSNIWSTLFRLCWLLY